LRKKSTAVWLLVADSFREKNADSSQKKGKLTGGHNKTTILTLQDRWPESAKAGSPLSVTGSIAHSLTAKRSCKLHSHSTAFLVTAIAKAATGHVPSMRALGAPRRASCLEVFFYSLGWGEKGASSVCHARQNSTQITGQSATQCKGGKVKAKGGFNRRRPTSVVWCG
jgi:hypothetical protein